MSTKTRLPHYGWILVVGIYLVGAPAEGETQAMCALFPRVVVATPAELPEKPGAFLTSLRV